MSSSDASVTAVLPSSVVVQRTDEVAATIDEVTAILSADRGVYFLLDSTASVIWNRLSNPTRVADLCADLVTEFEVNPGDCERDVLAFLNDMLARGLVRVVS